MAFIIFFIFFLKKFEKVEKTVFFRAKIFFRCTLSLILGLYCNVDRKIAQNGSLFTSIVCNCQIQFSILDHCGSTATETVASHLLKGEIPFAFLTHFFNNTTYSVMCGLWIIQVKKSLIYQRDTWDSRKADVDWLFYFLIFTT
jgi:hypothetical protein